MAVLVKGLDILNLQTILAGKVRGRPKSHMTLKGTSQNWFESFLEIMILCPTGQMITKVRIFWKSSCILNLDFLFLYFKIFGSFYANTRHSRKNLLKVDLQLFFHQNSVLKNNTIKFYAEHSAYNQTTPKIYLTGSVTCQKFYSPFFQHSKYYIAIKSWKFMKSKNLEYPSKMLTQMMKKVF